MCMKSNAAFICILTQQTSTASDVDNATVVERVWCDAFLSRFLRCGVSCSTIVPIVAVNHNHVHTSTLIRHFQCMWTRAKEKLLEYETQTHN